MWLLVIAENKEGVGEGDGRGQGGGGGGGSIYMIENITMKRQTYPQLLQ